MKELLKEAIRIGIDTGDIVSAVRWYQILEIVGVIVEVACVCGMFILWGWLIWRIVQKVRKWGS